jgi:DmsE family decaheme c-type cytochrome
LGFNNKAIPAAKKAAVCLSCHDGNRNLAFWDAGKHKQNDVSCNNCHALHGKPSGGSTVALRQGGPAISVFTSTERQLEYQTCAICHKDKLAQFNKPSHHPLIEGKIKCSDCHNPHGAMSLAMIKFEVTNDLCLSCHVDKRGPWINEHPPVAENCAICHTPHGSNHLKLLSLNPPQLCEECHRFGSTSSGGHPATLATGQPMTSPQAATSTTMRFMARGCVNCHRFIHGSNSAGTTGLQGRAFVR